MGDFVPTPEEEPGGSSAAMARARLVSKTTKTWTIAFYLRPKADRSSNGYFFLVVVDFQGINFVEGGGVSHPILKS